MCNEKESFMADQKIDNLLNLAMDATPQERRKSGNLNVGYDPATRLWDVIIKYSGPESGLAGNGIDPFNDFIHITDNVKKLLHILFHGT